MSNIFEVLRRDHDKQRELLEELVSTSGESQQRKQAFEKLKKQLDDHAKYEERYFYKPLISSDLTQGLSRHGIAEHKEIDDIIEDLVSMPMDSTGWLTRAKTLKDKVSHHLKEEEQEFFQMAGKVLSDSQKSELADAYSSNMTP